MRFWIALVAGGLSAFVGLSDADACSPPLPGLRTTIPEDGGSYPANGIVLLFGDGVALDATVTVDGAPASLVQATEFPVGFMGGIGARVQPEPAAGQEVVITGDFCDDAMDESFGCEDKTIRYVATAADDVAPAAPASVSFDVYDHADFHSSGGDCQSDSDLAWFVHVDADAPEAGGTPVAHLVEGFAPDATETTVMRLVFVDGATTDVTFRASASQLGGRSLGEAMCFRVSTFDAAGHQSAASDTVCAPCHLREESGDGDSSSPPDEPSWDEDDLYEDGPCGDGSSGCACDVAGTRGLSATWPMLLSLSALAMCLRRRLRRR